MAKCNHFCSLTVAGLLVSQVALAQSNDVGQTSKPAVPTVQHQPELTPPAQPSAAEIAPSSAAAAEAEVPEVRGPSPSVRSAEAQVQAQDARRKIGATEYHRPDHPDWQHDLHHEYEHEVKHEPHWYEKLKIRGYTQLRYDNLPTFDKEDHLTIAQASRYIGDGNTFNIRRARVIIYGDVHPRVSVYLQTDFASVPSGTSALNTAIVRDWYFDLYLDDKKEFRLRLGQSKVPFGFENLQSSQNRLPLDRNDAMNSTFRDERELGIFAYWAPAETRKLLKHLVDDNLKGSGDYGVVRLGIFNGQNANRFDTNNNFHVLAGASYPFWVGHQIIEIGGGAYTGMYTQSYDDEDFQIVGGRGPDHDNLVDRRAFATFVLYPQPIGLLIEGNFGEGPAQKKGNPEAEEGEDLPIIKKRGLWGIAGTLSYKFDEPFGSKSIIPFVRGNIYNGGKKFETNAPYYRVREAEFGVEWQLNNALELTTVYVFTKRTSSETFTDMTAQLWRVQVQVNY